MHGDTWWMWVLMLTATVGFWVLVALAVQALLTDRRTDRNAPCAPAAQPQPRDLLDSRLARGEIDPEEYRRVRELLDQPTSARPA